MLVDSDIPPERSLYYLGACVLDLMRQSRSNAVDLASAYTTLNLDRPHSQTIPFSYFLLSLDWLFILGLIDINEKGDIKRCF